MNSKSHRGHGVYKLRGESEDGSDRSSLPANGRLNLTSWTNLTTGRGTLGGANDGITPEEQVPNRLSDEDGKKDVPVVIHPKQHADGR